MDTECILITKEGAIVEGVGSGDSVDLIRKSPSDIPGVKAFCIGFLPQSITGKKIRVYVEDEDVFNLMTRNWK